MRKLKEWLTANNHSQEWLARQLGVTQGAVSHWITGRMTPTADNLVKMSDVTGLTLDQLMDRE